MIGREIEIEKLRELLRSENSEFAAIYGRRRIGKTYLVNEAYGSRYAFHHAGLKEGGIRKQLNQFRLSLRQQGHDDCPALKDWQEAFFELGNFLGRQRNGKKVVFIDEMPWMDTAKSGFLVALEGFWNGWACLRKDIVLVVCGSATSWIVKNIIRNRDGLYNRVRTRIRLLPFTLRECELYAERELHLQYSRRDIVEVYMAFGGVAYYWSLLERGKSPAQNFDALFFGEQDGLRLEYDELYRSLFRHPDKYMSVVDILRLRRSGFTRDEIIAKLGTAGGGDVTRVLGDLEECGFIRKYLPSAGAKNGGCYQLIDNFTLFHFNFVGRNPPRDGDNWSRGLSDQERSTWRGFAFERVCLLHVPQIKAALGISGVHAEVYSWQAKSGDAGETGAQVDLLLDRRDGIVNLCEMKYVNGVYAIGKAESLKLKNRVEAFRKLVSPDKSIHLTLVTPEGIAKNEYRWDVQSEVTLDDLFRA